MSFWQPSLLTQQIAVIDASTNTQLTYHQLNQLIEDFAKQLSIFSGKTLGIIFCKNNIASLITYLACLRYKHAVFLLDAELNTSLANNLITLYKPDWILSPTNVLIDNLIYKQKTEFLNDYFYITQKQENLAIYADLALLLSTSGSTGNPKVVRLSYKNLDANAESIANYLNLSPQERPITTLPIHYSYGLSVINSHLFANATLLLTNDSVSMREFWDFAKQHNTTSLSGVPYTYQILKQIRIETLAPPSLKTLTQAGGKLSAHLTAHFLQVAQQRNWQFYVMYGQTEATARISYVPPALLQEKIGSVGMVIPNGKLSIDAKTSELIYEGPNVMLGYAENRADLVKGDEYKGILRTGDLAKQDEDGLFYITGRSKRFLKLFGLRINLEDVEILVENTYQMTAASTGNDEKLHIFIENKQHLTSVKALISDHYKLHSRAIEVHCIDDIPRTLRGKPDYNKLQSIIGVEHAI